MINDDRTVHAARADGTAVARYDRSGKYYAETPTGGRRQIKLAEAVEQALLAAAEPGGYVNLGRAGGLSFDSAYRRATAAAARKVRP